MTPPCICGHSRDKHDWTGDAVSRTTNSSTFSCFASWRERTLSGAYLTVVSCDCPQYRQPAPGTEAKPLPGFEREP